MSLYNPSSLSQIALFSMTEAEISGQKRNSFNKGKAWKDKMLLLYFYIRRKNFNRKEKWVKFIFSVALR